MFKPMYDLESLTEAQREEYYLSACEYFEVPSELNLLAFIWMDSGDAKRNLVLYAKKGATDIIRAKREISTISLEQFNGPGYVGWIAKGQDHTKRIEQAVGVASTEGLRGQALASAVMIAQTRATRRMTLQFVGGGLLDESEVNGMTTDINRSGVSLASMATLPAPVQPSVGLNSDPGKDITEGQKAEQALVNAKLDGITAEISRAPTPFSGGSVIPAATETLEEVAKPRKPRKRTRPELSPEEPVSTPVETFSITEIRNKQVAVVHPDVAPALKEALTSVSSSDDIPESLRTAILNAAIDPVIEAAAKDLDCPTAEETKVWKAKLSLYTKPGGVLSQGGMTENVIGRVRLYVLSLFPDIPNTGGRLNLTNAQWRQLLENFKRISTEEGPIGLVNVIEGAAKS